MTSAERLLCRLVGQHGQLASVGGHSLLVRLSSTGGGSKLEQIVPVVADFPARHIGPRKHDARTMLKQLGYTSLDELTDAAVPDDIKLNRDLALDEPLSEFELIKRIKSIADKNQVR